MTGQATSSGRGGARAGAGRKPLREKYLTKVNAAEKTYAEALAMAAQTLLERAKGGTVRTEEKWAPAGTVMIEDVVRDADGEPILDMKTRKPFRYKQPAFPDKPADELVLIERRVIGVEKDREAAIYITDRILGKPVAAIEAEVTGDGGGAIMVAFGDRVLTAYGDTGDQSEDSEITE